MHAQKGNGTHAVVIHHVDGECSTILTTQNRMRAIERAFLQSRMLTIRESVSACGFVFRGICPAVPKPVFAVVEVKA